MMRKLISILLALGCFPLAGICQKDSISTAIVRGIAFDSVHNYVLGNATAAIYRADTAILLAYRLTDNFGEFQFEKVPVDFPLKIVLSYIGYQDKSIHFTLTKKDLNKDLGKIYLNPKDGVLEEVKVVYIPPVRMNKDTLEFNADAFDINGPAVVEDLLKKLPGFILWGDGSITVNGKEVKSLLVNGKPFFGGSMKVATQNIPKGAVDKVQVYQQEQNPANNRDSSTEVNIKLKADKSSGYFGKFSVGQGSNHRNEQHASLNFFSPKTQIGLIASRNNTNRIAGNTSGLMENNTFRGSSEKDYQPQFNLPGSNKILEAGLLFQRDFIEKPDFYNKNRLEGNYFLNNNRKEISENVQTVTAIDNNENIITHSDYNNKNISSKQQLESKYEIKDNLSSFGISASASFDHSDDKASSSGVTYDAFKTVQSSNDLQHNSLYDNKRFLLNSFFDTEWRNRKNAPTDRRVRIDYSVTISRSDENRNTKSRFNSMDLPMLSRIFDRNYNNEKNIIGNRLAARLENLGKLKLFAGKRLLIGVEADVSANTNKIDNKVYDKSAVTDDYLINSLLTNQARFQAISVRPAVNLSNTISKSLSNRYDKGLTTSLSIREQLYHQNVGSNLSFQNNKSTYYKAIPELLFQYTDYRFGKYRNTYTIGIKQYSIFPDAEQLLLLADSSDMQYVRAGNPGLKPSDIRDLSIQMAHITFGTNQFSYSVNLQAGSSRNYIGDSSIIFKNGQTNYFFVNLPGHRYVNAGLNLSNAFKVREQKIQVMISAKSTVARVPTILNNVFYRANSHEHFSDVKIYYYPTSFLGIDFAHSYVFYRRYQKGGSFDFKSSVNNSNIHVIAKVTPRLSLNSNISFVHNRFTGGREGYKIWNTSVSYRILKEQNGEIKFAAFDLLKENSNIGYRNSNTSLSTITNNVLQQYFMLTLSFFPGKFGR